jgi:hypothetical protein
LRKSERNTTTPDQLTLDPDERSKFIKQLYRNALDQGQINLNPSSTASTNAGPVATVAAHSTETEKGATMLKNGYNQITGSFSDTSIVKPQGTNSVSAKPLGVSDVMELALLGNINITDADFIALAADRAKVVRAYIADTGKVEAERIFLTDVQSGVKTNGSRVYLQLQ